jgi:hypothetical protein
MKKDFSDTRLGRRMSGVGAIKDFDWPENCGDIGIRIDVNGQWFYGGSPIGRMEMCRLFASILQCDDEGKYWMVTPYERIVVEVADVPFMAVDMDRRQEGEERESIYFVTNMEQEIRLDRDHELRIDYKEGGEEPRPYVRVRKNLWARLTRSVFYRLVEGAELDGKGGLYVKSGDEFFVLGEV